MKRPKKNTRVYRDLTPQEAARVRKSREEAEQKKEQLLALGRRYKAETDAKRAAAGLSASRPKRRGGPDGIGDRLKRLRTERALTQQAVAEAAAATPLAREMEATPRGLQSALSQIESGVIKNPGILTVNVLCRGLGVSIGELLPE